jgi:hypothetical protein
MTAPLPRALHLTLLLGLLALGGCATGTSATARPSPFPGALLPPETWTGPLASVPTGLVLETALALEGRPYLFGGTDPAAGFDCSGLVWYVFRQHQVTLPRTTVEQSLAGRPVGPKAIEPGDLVFFSTTAKGPSHVGIALDRRTLIHAPSTGTVVRVERFDTAYWQSRLIGARRLIAPYGEVGGGTGDGSSAGAGGN